MEVKGAHLEHPLGALTVQIKAGGEGRGVVALFKVWMLCFKEF